MAFEALPGIKIIDPSTKQAFIIADYFSVYTNYENKEEVPVIYKWGDLRSVTETKDAFILADGVVEYVISKKLIPDQAVQIRARAIIEGAISANPNINYKYGRRILPPKTLCSNCEIPPEAYVATGVYQENEINNSNIILHYPGLDRVLWVFAIAATIATFILQLIFFGGITGLPSVILYAVIALFGGAAVGMTTYLFFAFWAKTLYGKILKEDFALLEEITFVVCNEGFMAAETEVYDFSDIIRWHQVEYFIETNHVYIIFNKNKAVFWLPKRLFPKELHKELGDFIADRLLLK